MGMSHRSKRKMEQTKASNAAARARFAVEHNFRPSQQLFDVLRAAAAINVFLQTPEKLVQWANGLDPVLCDEITLFGMKTLIKLLGRSPTAATPESLFRAIAIKNSDSNQRNKHQRDRSQQFSRIVEMLDAHKVGDRLLGDCTKGDLLRAAADAESLAGEATMNAQFYRLLAGMLQDHGVTVRQANNRKEIVGLLTTTFREAA